MINFEKIEALAGKPLTRFCKLATKSVSPEGRDGLRRCAFTLAEVLITLGIIGIVAAMTLPTLIHKYQSIVLKSYFQKSYAATSNAIMTAKANLGVGNFAKYCTYYNGSDYINQQQCYDALYEALKINPDKLKLKSGNFKYDVLRTGSVKTYNNKKEITSVNQFSGASLSGNFYYIKNNDGSYISFIISGGGFTITIDTNGAKGPNRLGYDIFKFQIDKKNDSLGPVKQSKAYTEDEINNYTRSYAEEYGRAGYGNPCNKNSNQALNGVGCAWYAVNDIDPDTGKKGYWENLPK